MAIRNVVVRGDELLAKKSRKVEVFDARLHTLIDDMIATMHKKEGVGIAAPQVGILRRVVIVEPDAEHTMTLVNPEILEYSGKAEGVEGCLSVPNVWGIVERPTHVKVRAQDRDGNTFEFEAEDFHARIVCHELDHLDGTLFVDRAIRLLDPDELEEDE
ncbi:MAG: peptide deformylase [Ruminococcaceae bacterium]|nr:peptide deformylase [Oscillospiraceae bacterium]